MAQINLTGSVGVPGSEAILGNYNVVFTTNANHTLTADEFSNQFLNVTSSVSLTLTRQLLAPLNQGQEFIVQNNTTGGQSILVIGISGTGITVPNGATYSVVCDGTNYIQTSTTIGPVGAAGGDLSGTYPNPTVAAIDGIALSGTPSAGQVLTATSPVTADWATPSAGFVAGGDLSGTSTSQTVIKIQGVSVSTATPTSAQVLEYNSGTSKWTPTALPSSLPPSGSAGGDLNGTYPNPTVSDINGSSVPAGGSLTTGNTLAVTGSSTLAYSSLNLAGGSGYVTGFLPTANQVAQSVTMTGDVTSSGGTTAGAATSVAKLQGITLTATSPSTSQVLQYNGSAWVPATAPAAPPTGSAGGDLSGTYPNPTVAGIQGNTFTPGAPTEGQFVVATSSSNYGPVTLSGDLSESSSTPGQVSVTSITGSAGVVNIASTGNILTWNNTTSYPGINQPALASTSSGSGTFGYPITLQAQPGQAATGGGNNGGAGGILQLQAGPGGASGSGTGGIGGYISLAVGGVSGAATGGGVFIVSDGYNFTPSIANTFALSASSNQQTLLFQTQSGSTSSGSGLAGLSFTMAAQAGQSATGVSNNGGNGGELILTSGAGGTSGSATAGNRGDISLQLGSTELIDISGTTIGNITFTNAAAVPNITQTAPASVGTLTGTAGKAFTITGQTGGATSDNSASAVGGVGSTVTFTSGTGGSATAAAGKGANGGGLIFNTGSGGTGVTSNGLPGTLTLETGSTAQMTIAPVTSSTGTTTFGSQNTVNLNNGTLQFASSASTPTIKQAGTSGSTSSSLLIQAEGSGSVGGSNLLLAAGPGTGSSASGTVQLQVGPNVSGTTSFTVLTVGGAGITYNSISVAVTTGNTTLAANQYCYPYITLTGSISGNVTVIFPTTKGGSWIVDATAITLNGHTISLQANSNVWGTTIGITNIYEVTYNGTKLYGTTLAP